MSLCRSNWQEVLPQSIFPLLFFYNQLVAVADFSFSLCLEALQWQQRPTFFIHGAKWDRETQEWEKEGRKRKSGWIGEWVSKFCVCLTVWRRTSWIFSISKHLASIQTWEAAGEWGDRSLDFFPFSLSHTHITGEKLPVGVDRESSQQSIEMGWHESSDTGLWKHHGH